MLITICGTFNCRPVVFMKLLQLSRDVMVGSLMVMVAGLFVGFGLESKVGLGVQVIGHTLAMIAAVGLKLGYIMRLEALSVLNATRRQGA